MLVSYNNDLKADNGGSPKSCHEQPEKLFIGVLDDVEHDGVVHFQLALGLPAVLVVFNILPSLRGTSSLIRFPILLHLEMNPH